MYTPSEAETQIAGILNQLKVVFKVEQTYSGLCNNEGTALPIDFSIIVNDRLAFIEYNGSQHYNTGKTLKERDYYKQLILNGSKRLSWSQKQGIPLLIIHYKNKNQFQEILENFVRDVASSDIITTQNYTQKTILI